MPREDLVGCIRLDPNRVLERLSSIVVWAPKGRSKEFLSIEFKIPEIIILSSFEIAKEESRDCRLSSIQIFGLVSGSSLF